ncbi:MAG: DDE-type integrase/transposase/recombinase [Actinobacteria bacterium]|nr:DDE-type integrase/transposase/recombinase [Actinomycetota bacterium]
MITKEAKQRVKILIFWKKHGLQAAIDAYGAKQSTLYLWRKIYKDSGHKTFSLNPGSQSRINNNKREINPLVLKEIRRLRLEECPNMGKTKVKKNLDVFCQKNKLPVYSESKIGRIIKEKKIYHHRQKVYHNGAIKTIKRRKKKRKPSDLSINSPGDLIEIDVVVRFIGLMKRYIVTAVDVHSRYSFAFCYNRHNSLCARDFIKKLEQAFPYGIKAIQTDNGSEFHKYFMRYLEERKIIHYWNYKGQPYKQGHIEKFNRTIQEEFVDQNEIWFDDVGEFNEKMLEWIMWYNTKRYHWSLNLMSPVDYLLNNNMISNMRWTNTTP